MSAAVEYKSTILFHGNCIDGFTSAFIANSALSTKGPVQMFPISPNQERTWPLGQRLRDTHVFMVDISVPQSYRDKWMKEGALSIVCIDHHASSVEHWPQGACPINTESCAALQTHAYFYPGVAPPGWLLAVDRIDRWTDDITDADRCIREILSIIAHKTDHEDVREAMTLMMKFAHDMNDAEAVQRYLVHGKQVLEQKDLQLLRLMERGTILTITAEIAVQWSLPETWVGRNVFIMDNTSITIDSTEAAYLMFKYSEKTDIFINYRKKAYHGKPFPQYIFSARARRSIGLDITQGTMLKGHPQSAGASVVQKPGMCIPFIMHFVNQQPVNQAVEMSDAAAAP